MFREPHCRTEIKSKWWSNHKPRGQLMVHAFCLMLRDSCCSALRCGHQSPLIRRKAPPGTTCASSYQDDYAATRQLRCQPDGLHCQKPVSAHATARCTHNHASLAETKRCYFGAMVHAVFGRLSMRRRCESMPHKLKPILTSCRWLFRMRLTATSHHIGERRVRNLAELCAGCPRRCKL